MSSRSRTSKSPGLETAFSAIIRDRNWQRKFDQHRIFPAWDDLVDEETAAHARPLKVVKDVLWLEVDHSAWVQQLQFQKIALLETLNGFLKESRFSDIRFSVGSREREKPRREPSTRFVPPPAEEVEAFREQAAFIDDDAVREALVRLWYLSRACRRE